MYNSELTDVRTLLININEAVSILDQKAFRKFTQHPNEEDLELICSEIGLQIVKLVEENRKLFAVFSWLFLSKLLSDHGIFLTRCWNWERAGHLMGFQDMKMYVDDFHNQYEQFSKLIKHDVTMSEILFFRLQCP